MKEVMLNERGHADNDERRRVDVDQTDIHISNALATQDYRHY